MSEERTLGVKDGEEITPTGTHQPENKAPELKPEVNVDEIESEIDKTLGDEGDEEDDPLAGIDAEDQGDDTVVVSKSKLEKKLRDGSNYRRGLISLKGKVGKLRKPTAEAQTPKDQPGASEDVVTKKELAETNSRMVINSLTKPKLPNGDDNPTYVKDLDEHWAEIMPYYTPRHGKQTPDAIQQDIFDALTLFRRDHPAKEKEEDANAATQISNENGEPGTKRQGGKPPERKHVLPKATSAKDWF